MRWKMMFEYHCNKPLTRLTNLSSHTFCTEFFFVHIIFLISIVVSIPQYN